MTDPLQIASLVLALLGAFMVLVLIGRRLLLAWRERRKAELERELQPVALDIIDGEIDPGSQFSARESRALAVIVARYSHRLAGEARANVATFFEGQGDVDAQIKALTSHRSWRRAYAAFVLGDMAASRAVPALVTALDDRHRDVRAAATRSLGLLGAADAVPQLIACLVARTVPWGVAGFALVTIGPPARDPLRMLLRDDAAAMRRSAAELLGYVGSPADAGSLIALLEDSSAEVRGAAARALGRVGADSAAAALRASLHDGVPSVRAAVAASLGDLDDIDATDALERMAAADEFEPAAAASRSLAHIDPKRSIALGQRPGAGPHLRQAASLAELGR